MKASQPFFDEQENTTHLLPGLTFTIKTVWHGRKLSFQLFLKVPQRRAYDEFMQRNYVGNQVTYL